MKVFATPHAVAGYIEHVAPAAPPIAERRIRTAQRLFRTLSRDQALILTGCRDSAGRKFVAVSEICTLSAESVTVAAVHPYWFYRETRPHWRAAGYPASSGDTRSKRARKRESKRLQERQKQCPN